MKNSEINVLVVDDEQVMRDLLHDVLTDAGYKVDTAGRGEDALEKIKADNFSIVITDLKMPGISGLEVLRKVKSTNSNACVIMITAYPSVESVTEAMRAGAYDYIVKPFNVEEISLVLRRAVERQQLIHEAGQKEFYQELSILDGLTGLYNHRHFYEVLPREIERAERYKQALSLLMIDLDDFKKFNDTNGHLAGDKLLQDLSEVLIKAVRSADMVFRYGGEEFTVICPQTSKQQVVEVAKRIFNLAREKLPVTMSVGLSAYPDDGKNVQEVVTKADYAMYQAKHLGKNRICVFGAEENEK
ncbi:MAG: diguanylate cyclase [Candidatus Omnitrophica bacterium]|nr:diguanylate cyclase [Candidatus Omnitrophota bacterium]MDD5610675.1 diguanylate cyclase [Candidatus Omnitrophota bacterium]